MRLRWHPTAVCVTAVPSVLWAIPVLALRARRQPQAGARAACSATSAVTAVLVQDAIEFFVFGKAAKAAVAACP